MQFHTLGGLAHLFSSQLRTTQLQSQVARLTSELSSGQTSDISRRLSGNFGYLADIEHDLTMLEAYRSAGTEAKTLTDVLQTSLSRLTDEAQTLSDAALTAAAPGAIAALTGIPGTARQVLDAMISTLNGDVAGRSIFSGAGYDSQPLPDPATFLALIDSATAGATTAGEIETALDLFFDPAQFQASVYRGSSMNMSPINLDEDTQISLSIRADSVEILAVLRSVSALATSSAATLPKAELSALSRTAGEAVSVAQDRLIDLQAKLGTTQNRLEQSGARHEAEISGLKRAREALTGIDPYDTATQLQASQSQLETLYALTARNAQLRLVNFL